MSIYTYIYINIVAFNSFFHSQSGRGYEFALRGTKVPASRPRITPKAVSKASLRMGHEPAGATSTHLSSILFRDTMVPNIE